MSQVSWEAITAAGGGWTLFGMLAWYTVHGLLTGKVVTRREADALQARINIQDETIADLQRQNAMLLREGLPTTNAVLTALRVLTEEPRK